MSKNEEDLFSLRQDLKFQLGTIDDLDWDYFLETAMRAKLLADEVGINMPECERDIHEIITHATEAIAE